MADASMLAVEYLRECFTFCDDGVLIWKARPRGHFATYQTFRVWNGHYAGARAGTLSHKGYIVVHLVGRLVFGRRIVWAMRTGQWPVGEIDHRNGVRSDNRLDNLREATVPREQQQNIKRYKSNKSGFIGVRLSSSGRWLAQITIDKKKLHLGTFASPEAAYTAYLAAKKVHHLFQPEVRDG